MEVLQVVTLLGSVTLLVGLFRLHARVVRNRVVPEIVDDEDVEE